MAIHVKFNMIRCRTILSYCNSPKKVNLSIEYDRPTFTIRVPLLHDYYGKHALNNVNTNIILAGNISIFSREKKPENEIMWSFFGSSNTCSGWMNNRPFTNILSYDRMQYECTILRNKSMSLNYACVVCYKRSVCTGERVHAGVRILLGEQTVVRASVHDNFSITLLPLVAKRAFGLPFRFISNVSLNVWLP